jgi:hypothetical protein
MTAFGPNYGTPGWQRAQKNKGRGGFSETGAPRYGEKGVGDDSLDHIDPIYDDDGTPGGATRSPPPHSPSKTGVSALSQEKRQGGGRREARGGSFCRGGVSEASRTRHARVCRGQSCLRKHHNL